MKKHKLHFVKRKIIKIYNFVGNTYCRVNLSGNQNKFLICNNNNWLFLLNWQLISEEIKLWSLSSQNTWGVAKIETWLM